ncbi:MAG: universal stress protein [Elusimicrobia bacterium]|nr:universal stress protein [Elusimicrobiota bacterium]
MDDSGPSQAAARTAKALARTFGSVLHLVHVQADFEAPVPIGSQGSEVMVRLSARQTNEIRVRQEKNFLRAEAGFPRDRLWRRTLTGWPEERVPELAARHVADLVVMGTHGYSGFSRVLWGSVAEAVIRRSRVPVLAVHERLHVSRPPRILVPCNLTPYADAALVYAVDFARALGAKVCVLCVTRAEAGWTDFTTRMLECHLRKVMGPDLAGVETRVRGGDPRSVILEEAAREPFDLIALSAHRHRFLQDFRLGSVANTVLRYSKASVLAVPSQQPHAAAPRSTFPPKWLTNKIY